MITNYSRRSTVRRAAAAVGSVAAALVLSACGGGGHDGMDMGDSGNTTAPSESAPSSESTDEHNDADVTFAQRMIPHHQQAVEMADLALDQASSEEVRTLAEQIRAAQAPEIEALSGWLEEWGEEVPDGGMDHSGMDMSEGMDMGGMMSEEDMAELENASGADFDTAFLEMMTEHHQGAVEMAETEQANGAYQPALDMAEDITTSQTAEIDQMNQLLGES
ncbi:DUF305 domain-containing protein [Streptomyces mayteni]